MTNFFTSLQGLCEIIRSLQLYEGKTFNPNIVEACHSLLPQKWPVCVLVCFFLQKSMTSAAMNDMNTLGLGLDLESRYQEAEKVWSSFKATQKAKLFSQTRVSLTQKSMTCFNLLKIQKSTKYLSILFF